ncbi:hypothetical protein CEXT_562241 [Caerostris extrusa]|uniref:Uncharacterized protein n=1 Tax=Caerostris extrusa TaxID=172846 RepID=A0AAV4SNI2_CAEEX|nr:hypothetical protein CEXT_562241 [Caerostris extrusa]
MAKISETILLDEFLTAVSILWFNDSFISSTRIVKESIDDILQGTHNKLPLVLYLAVWHISQMKCLFCQDI